MDFSKRKLFRSINDQLSYKDENYIRAALGQIDFAMDNEEVTDSFCNEYYKLKRNLEVIYPNLPNIVIGIITSIIVSLALDANLIVFAILVPLGLMLSLWILFNHATKQGTVLEPYLLKKMEDKIYEQSKNPIVEKQNLIKRGSKMKKKEYISPIWDKINIFLTITTIITSIFFITLFVQCFILSGDHPSHGMILGMCGVFASLASAFFIAAFMRIYEMLKQRQQQRNALKLLQPLFVQLHTTINQFYPQIKAFATINPDDTIRYSKDRVYYTNSSLCDGNRDFIDFDIEFEKAKFNLDQDLNACFNSPLLLQCNDIVINLLTNLKLNGFTLNLLEIQKASIGNGDLSQTAFMGIYENFIKFDSCYTVIAELAERKVLDNLSLLGDTEKDEYIKTIENILPQLPQHNGTIYKGNMRIK